MTIEEAKAKAKILEELNLDIWRASTSITKNELRTQFKDCWLNITSNGYKIIRRRELDPLLGYRVPKYKVREDDTQQMVSIVDNRSINGYHKGDCTTRCISFCTGVDYDIIQKEQFRNAESCRKYGYTWRSPYVWSKSLTSRGYTKLILPKHISAKVFLRKFNDCGIDNGIIAAVSSRHVAAIDMKTKKILDTWNSAGCRIISLFVPIADAKVWLEKINTILR